MKKISLIVICLQVVLLSPDATVPLMDMDPDLVYAIGGIVDRSVQKGVTLSFAEEQCIEVSIVGARFDITYQ